MRAGDSGKTSQENPAKLPVGRDPNAANLSAMNTPPTEHTQLPLSLRDILAFKGIESRYDRDCRNAAQRRLGVFKTENAAPIPGLEVTYLEFDPSVWAKMSAV